MSEKFKWAQRKEYFLLKFYRIITICPIVMTRDFLGLKTKFDKSVRIWAILTILCIISYAIGIIILRVFYVHPADSGPSYWSEATNVCGFVLTCLVIILETQSTPEEFEQFISFKEKLEKELQKFCNREIFENNKYLFISHYWKTIIAFQLIAWLTEILNLTSNQKNPLFKFYCCCLLIPTIITRFRCFQHRLYTGTLHFYIKMIRIKFGNSIKEMEYSELLARQKRQVLFTINVKKIFNDFTLSTHSFFSIFQMSNLVNKMFGFSLFMNILINFIQLLSNLFLIYTKLYREDLRGLPGLKRITFFPNKVLKFKSLFNISEEILFRITPSIFILMMLLVSCEDCTKEVVLLNIICIASIIFRFLQENMLAFLLTNFEANTKCGKIFDTLVIFI